MYGRAGRRRLGMCCVLSEVYLLINLFEKHVHNAVRHFSCVFFFFIANNIRIHIVEHVVNIGGKDNFDSNIIN